MAGGLPADRQDMKSFVLWPVVLLALFGTACGSESAEPEIITQRLAAPQTGSDGDTSLASTGGDTELGDDAGEESVLVRHDPNSLLGQPGSCGQFADNLVDDTLWLAPSEIRVFEVLLAPFGDRGTAIGDRFHRALDDGTVLAELFGAAAELDQLVLEECGQPGGGLTLEFIATLSDLIHDAETYCDRVAVLDPNSETPCEYIPPDHPVPTSFPCLESGGAAWDEVLDDDTAVVWRYLDCDTGETVIWSWWDGAWTAPEPFTEVSDTIGE